LLPSFAVLKPLSAKSAKNASSVGESSGANLMKAIVMDECHLVEV